MPQVNHMTHTDPKRTEKPSSGRAKEVEEEQGIQSFTHEEFISAQLMLGKTPQVTPATIRAAQEKETRVSGAAQEAKHCAVSGENKGRAWEKMREAEECHQEQEVRKRVKVKAAAMEVERRDVEQSITAPTPTVIRVITQKDQTESRVYPTGHENCHVISLHWVGNVDLDLSCVILNAEGLLESVFYFGSGDPTCGRLQHSGDVLRGNAPLGAIESITVDTGHLHPKYAYLYFVVSSFNAATPIGDAVSVDVSVRASDNAQIAANGALQDIVFYKTIELNEKNAQKAFAAIVVRLRRDIVQQKWVVENTSDFVQEQMCSVSSLVRPVKKHFDRNALLPGANPCFL